MSTRYLSVGRVLFIGRLVMNVGTLWVAVIEREVGNHINRSRFLAYMSVEDPLRAIRRYHRRFDQGSAVF